MTDKTGGAAFPSTRKVDRRNGNDWDGIRKEDMREVVTKGMTLRDYLAAKSMQGDFAAQSNEIGVYGHHLTDEQLADMSKFYYRMADAMLKARG